MARMTAEQLMNMAGSSPAQPTAGTSGVSSAGYQPYQPKPTPAEAAIAKSQKELEKKDEHPLWGMIKGVGSFATDVLAGGAKKLGDTLGTAAAASGAATDIGAANVTEQESRRKLSETLNRPDISEEQKTHIRNLLGQGTQVPTAEEQIPTLTKTATQVVGEGLETFVDIASAGQYKGMDKVLKSAPSIAKYLKLGAQGAVIGGTGALARAMEEKDPDIKRDIKNIAFSAATSGLASAALPAVIDGAVAGWKKLYSTMSGVPKEAIDQLTDNPETTIKAVRAAAADRPKAQKDIVDSFDSAMDVLNKDKSKAYQKSLEEIADRTIVSDVDPNLAAAGSNKEALAGRLSSKAQEYQRKIDKVEKQFAGKVAREDYQWKLSPLEERRDFYAKNADLALTDPSKAAIADPDANIWWKGDDGIWQKTKLGVSSVKSAMTKTLHELGFSNDDGVWEVGKSAMKKEHLGDINELASRIDTWDDFTPKGVNDLRKVIGSYEGGPEEKAYNMVIGKMKSSLASHIDDNAPDVIRNMNKNYAVAMDEINNLVGEIGKETASTTAKANKIIDLYNPKSAYRKSLVQKLGEDTTNDIMEQVNVYLMSEMAPRGVLRKVLEGAGALGGLAAGATVGPKALLIAPAAASASPRLGAEVTAATTKAARSGAAQTAGRLIRQEGAKIIGEETYSPNK